MSKGTGNNAENNVKQRRPGGITGRGFRPGKSGNPKGRPRTRGLLNALKARIAEATPDGRTVEDILVDVLLHEALHGRNKLGAIQTIFDRIEGKPKQPVQIDTDPLDTLTDEEIDYALQHGKMPDGRDLSYWETSWIETRK